MEIRQITASGVNCYLLRNDNDFFMVDTGFSRDRGLIRKTLERAGCRPGDLKLVLLTHGDTDHTGNAAWLRATFGAKLCLHPEEQRVAETGNMLHNRKPWPVLARKLAPPVMWLFGGTGRNRFTPDIHLQDGNDLSPYGLEARVLHVPGHTWGSVSILTSDGDLFCGDLLVCRRVPGRNHLIDDGAVMDASIARLKGLKIGTVYPGHGRAFRMDEFAGPC